MVNRKCRYLCQRRRLQSRMAFGEIIGDRESVCVGVWVCGLVIVWVCGGEEIEKGGYETDEVKMGNAGKRAGENKREDAPQGSTMTNKKLVYMKPVRLGDQPKIHQF